MQTQGKEYALCIQGPVPPTGRRFGAHTHDYGVDFVGSLLGVRGEEESRHDREIAQYKDGSLSQVRNIQRRHISESYLEIVTLPFTIHVGQQEHAENYCD